MKKKINWLNTILIMGIAVYLIDLNTQLYRHPANTIPGFRYTIIGLSLILFLFIFYIIIGKRRTKK